MHRQKTARSCQTKTLCLRIAFDRPSKESWHERAAQLTSFMQGTAGGNSGRMSPDVPDVPDVRIPSGCHLRPNAVPAGCRLLYFTGRVPFTLLVERTHNQIST